MIKICAFLGNVGKQYERNRHNAAWLFLDSLPLSSNLSWSAKHKGLVASADISGAKRWFLKPGTYMNLSGEAIADLARFVRVEPAEILVVHDEIELPFGYYSLKMGGGLGGHNGLRSFVQCLGTNEFPRLRIGVGKPAHGDIAGYVLSDFTYTERECLDCSIFPQVGKAFDRALAEENFARLAEEYRKVNALG